jgi:hypothetical protein
MDRAYLALVQRRLKEHERAQLDRVTAEAAGIQNAHAGALLDTRAALLAALSVWETALLHTTRDTGDAAR